MKIDKWASPGEQTCTLGRHEWSVARLIALSRDLPVMQIPLDHLNVYLKFNALTLREMAMHVAAINNADLRCPIILDEDGELLDGRHRLVKAMITGAACIPAVRFDVNPEPCKVKEEGS